MLHNVHHLAAPSPANFQNGSCDNLDRRIKAKTQLQRIDAELASFLVEFETYGFGAQTDAAVRANLREAHRTVRFVWEAIRMTRSSSERKILRASLDERRVRLAAQLNAEMSHALEARRTGIAKEALAAYQLALEQATSTLDRVFARRRQRTRRPGKCRNIPFVPRR